MLSRLSKLSARVDGEKERKGKGTAKKKNKMGQVENQEGAIK